MSSARPRRWLIGSTALLLGFLLATEVSSANVSCRYKPSTHVLSVTGGGETYILVRRKGTAIDVSTGAERVNCHGSPTVMNTDHINTFYDGYMWMDISLAGGPFAPGATPEVDSSSEIEITVRGFGEINIQGTPGPDHFTYVKAEQGSGLMVNASSSDKDIDFLLPDPDTTLFWVEGGRGNDVIEVDGHVSIELAIAGGGGNDTLNGGGGGGEFSGTILDGGGGRDHIVGSTLSDLIAPGPGTDLVEARGGADQINLSADKKQDQIKCGGAFDILINPEPFDRRRSCEQVQRRRR